MPSTLTYPGVYIEELPSGVHTIVGVTTSITAFIGTAPKGPVNQATTIGGFADYERTFGGLDKKSPMGFAVQDFFLNGGSQAMIVRLYHSPDTTKDSTKLPIGKLALIAANAGTWGKNLRAIVDRNVTDEAARRLGLCDASKLFNLTVLEDVPNGLIERFANVSVEESPRRIDKVLKAQSKLAQWDGTLDPTKPPDIPGNNPTKAMKGGNRCRFYFRAEIDVVSRISTEKVNRPTAAAGRRLLGEIRSRVRVQCSWPSSIGSGILESSIYLPGRSHDDQPFRRSQAGHRGTWRGARVRR